MTTRKCNKCGWEVDAMSPLSRCPVCSTKYDVGICRKCGELVEYYRKDRCVCRKCYDTVVRKPDAYSNVFKRRREVYDEIVQKVKQIPKSYPTLTEQQWLQAVRYFDGCALCESESVDARWYFIPMKNGGRYCDWNIIPVCEKCATKTRLNPNYFVMTRDKPTGLIKILDYLEDKIDAAIAKGKE